MKTLSYVIATLIFCSVANAQPTPVTRAQCHEKFKNVLLVINFNSPFFKNVSFLKQLYQGIFADILFYSDSKNAPHHPEVTLFPTHKGWLLGEVVEDVLTKYPEYEGYIILQDDCILNVWNCLSFDLNKAWLPFATLDAAKSNYRWYQAANMEPGSLPPHSWDNKYKYEAIRKAWEHFTPQEHENLAHNVGVNMAPAAQCDLFYIPQRLRKDVLRLNSLLKETLCEIAIPTIFAALESINDWQQETTMYWSTDWMQQVSYPTEFTCVHPVKLSQGHLRTITQRMFNQYIM